MPALGCQKSHFVSSSHIRKLCLNEDYEEATDPKQILDELKQIYSSHSVIIEKSKQKMKRMHAVSFR